MAIEKYLNRLYLGKNISFHSIAEDYHVFQIRDKTGYGEMQLYKVLDGIYIMYNDFHLQRCTSYLKIYSDFFCIDHCREGRIENKIDDMNSSYMEAGDLRIDNRKGHDSDFFFPLSHYHGLTIVLFFQEAQNSLKAYFHDFPVDLRKLKEKFLSKQTAYLLRKNEQIQRCFSELYYIPQNIKKFYIRIKIYELLLYLYALEFSDHSEDVLYFYKPQVEKVKHIKKQMIKNLDRHFTLKELSKQHDIPLTSLKNCFKGIYGQSVFSYMRTYRMNRAASLLKNTDESVANIALEVGYNNPSKFSSAFKKIIGISPLDYRKSPVQSEQNCHSGAERGL